MNMRMKVKEFLLQVWKGKSLVMHVCYDKKRKRMERKVFILVFLPMCQEIS